MKIKEIVKNTGLGKWAISRGLFSKSKLKISVINFVFQRIFRQNSECHLSVHFTSVITCPEKVSLGKNSERSLMRSPGCYIQGINGVKIGSNVWWGPNVGIISANHNPDDIHNHLEADSIEIGDDVWIGMNSIILPGVKLGDRVVVGAGSVVTKSFPNNAVIAGSPAKLIKSR